MKTFKYTGIHIPTGKTFNYSCNCHSREEFLELLNTWNHSSSWRYITDIRVTDKVVSNRVLLSKQV